MNNRLIRFLCLLLLSVTVCTLFSSAASEGDTDTEWHAPMYYVLEAIPRDPSDKETTKTAKTAETTTAEKEREGDFHIGFALSEEDYTTYSENGGTLTAEIDFAVGENWISEDEDGEGAPLTISLSECELYYDMWVGDFQSEAFRNCFPKGTFTSTQKKVKKVKTDVYSLASDVTVNTRARFVYVPKDGKKEDAVYSDWSDPFAFGKQADVLPEIAYLDYPVISDVSLDGDTESVTFQMDVSGNVRSCALRMQYAEMDGTVVTHLEYSKNGGEWTEAELPSDFNGLLSGEKTVALPAGTVSDYTFLQLRMYNTAQGKEDFDYRSEYSEIVTASFVPQVETYEIRSEETTAPSENETSAVSKKCPVCGNCSQPLNVCLYVWVVGFLVILVIVLTVVLIHNFREKKDCPHCGKRCKLNAAQCGVCGYRFTTVFPKKGTFGTNTVTKKDEKTSDPAEEAESDAELDAELFTDDVIDEEEQARMEELIKTMEWQEEMDEEEPYEE